MNYTALTLDVVSFPQCDDLVIHKCISVW